MINGFPENAKIALLRTFRFHQLICLVPDVPRHEKVEKHRIKDLTEVIEKNELRQTRIEQSIKTLRQLYLQKVFVKLLPQNVNADVRRNLAIIESISIDLIKSFYKSLTFTLFACNL